MLRSGGKIWGTCPGLGNNDDKSKECRKNKEQVLRGGEKLGYVLRVWKKKRTSLNNDEKIGTSAQGGMLGYMPRTWEK